MSTLNSAPFKNYIDYKSINETNFNTKLNTYISTSKGTFGSTLRGTFEEKYNRCMIKNLYAHFFTINEVNYFRIFTSNSPRNSKQKYIDSFIKIYNLSDFTGTFTTYLFKGDEISTIIKYIDSYFTLFGSANRISSEIDTTIDALWSNVNIEYSDFSKALCKKIESLPYSHYSFYEAINFIKDNNLYNRDFYTLDDEGNIVFDDLEEYIDNNGETRYIVNHSDLFGLITDITVLPRKLYSREYAIYQHNYDLDWNIHLSIYKNDNVEKNKAANTTVDKVDDKIEEETQETEKGSVEEKTYFIIENGYIFITDKTVPLSAYNKFVAEHIDNKVVFTDIKNILGLSSSDNNITLDTSITGFSNSKYNNLMELTDGIASNSPIISDIKALCKKYDMHCILFEKNDMEQQLFCIAYNYAGSFVYKNKLFLNLGDTVLINDPNFAKHLENIFKSKIAYNEPLFIADILCMSNMPVKGDVNNKCSMVINNITNTSAVLEDNTKNYFSELKSIMSINSTTDNISKINDIASMLQKIGILIAELNTTFTEKDFISIAHYYGILKDNYISNSLLTNEVSAEKEEKEEINPCKICRKGDKVFDQESLIYHFIHKHRESSKNPEDTCSAYVMNILLSSYISEIHSLTGYNINKNRNMISKHVEQAGLIKKRISDGFIFNCSQPTEKFVMDTVNEVASIMRTDVNFMKTQ